MNDQKAPPKKRAILRLNPDSGIPQIVKLRMGATIFGRETADVIIKDKEISSIHCQIQYIGDNYHLMDMNSSNGTFVNSERITKHTLNNGDRILIGGTHILFELVEEAAVKNVSTVMQSKNQQTTNTKSKITDSMMQNSGASLWGIKLEILYPNKHIQQVELSQNTTIVGRGSSFASFEDDSQISRKHLLIKINDFGEIFIEDQGSTNGSFLNGTKINGIHRVTHNDTIKVGSCLLRIFAQKR